MKAKTTYDGWMFDGKYEIDFYPEPTNMSSEYYYSIDVEDGVITTIRSHNKFCWKDCCLCEFFMDWRHPIDNERFLFEIEFGIPYPSQEILDKYTKVSA